MTWLIGRTGAVTNDGLQRKSFVNKTTYEASTMASMMLYNNRTSTEEGWIGAIEEKPHHSDL